LAVAELVVARRDVVRARPALDELERVVLRDAARRAADHDGQLGLGVDVPGPGRQHDRVAVAAERVRELGEQERRLRRLRLRLAGVVGVVETDAHDLRSSVPEAALPVVAEARVAHQAPCCGGWTRPSARRARKRSTVAATPSASGVSAKSGYAAVNEALSA